MNRSTFFATFSFLIALLGFSCVSSASTINARNWYNESVGAYKMQIWVTNPNVSIKNIKFSKGSYEGWNWRYTDETHSSAILTGPATRTKNEVSPSIYFEAPKHQTSFAVEWAEVSKDNSLTGTNYYKHKNWTFTKGDIVNSPTPISGTLLIFGCGLFVVAWIKRKNIFSENF